MTPLDSEVRHGYDTCSFLQCVFSFSSIQNVFHKHSSSRLISCTCVFGVSSVSLVTKYFPTFSAFFLLYSTSSIANVTLLKLFQPFTQLTFDSTLSNANLIYFSIFFSFFSRLESTSSNANVTSLKSFKPCTQVDYSGKSFSPINVSTKKVRTRVTVSFLIGTSSRCKRFRASSHYSHHSSFSLSSSFFPAFYFSTRRVGARALKFGM